MSTRRRRSVSTGEQASEHPGEQSGEQSGEGAVSTPASTSRMTNREIVIGAYWQLHHAGMLDTVVQTELAKRLGIPRGTVSRIWPECVNGQHPDPGPEHYPNLTNEQE